MPALALTVVIQLATSSACGGAEPGSELARRLVATATVESGFDPYAVHVNGPAGGLRRHFKAKQEAIAYAHALDAAGIDYDAGLLQINRRQFARHGLTVDTAFDACRSMRAGSDHLIDDFRAVWTLASRRYNCGNINCGVAYAQHVDALVEQSPDNSPSPAPAAPAPPKPPPLRDALHAPDNGGLTDLLAGHHPQKSEPATIPDSKDTHD